VRADRQTDTLIAILRYQGRCMLSSCVRLSVCPSATSQYCIATTGQIEVVFVLLPITYCVIRKFGNLQKLGYFVPNATASRSRCQHQQSSSSSSSTVKLVDDTYTTVDELWLFTVTLQLHYCDLLWICCTAFFLQFTELLVNTK